MSALAFFSLSIGAKYLGREKLRNIVITVSNNIDTQQVYFSLTINL